MKSFWQRSHKKSKKKKRKPYLYIETPEGKIIDLNRFFKEENGEMIQIDKDEFDERKSRKVEKK